MRGYITERDFAGAECEFPGICAFYAGLTEKPMTFLELVWRFLHRSELVASGEAAARLASPTSAHRLGR